MVNKVEQRIIELITPIVDRRKELLWDLTYTKEGGQKVLRILLDKPNHQFITMAVLTVDQLPVMKCLVSMPLE